MRTVLALMLALLLLCLVGAAPAGAADDELDVIRARMAERQERARTFVYEWTVDRSVQQGLFNFVQHRFEESPAEAADAPPEDTPVNEAFRLVVDGQSFHLDVAKEVWSTTQRAMVPRESSMARSDTESWVHLGSRGRLIVGRDTVATFKAKANVLVPLLVYRPLDPVLGFAQADGLRLVGEEELGGLDCAVVEFDEGWQTMTVTRRMWLAREMDYVPIHSERSRDATLTDEVDLSYAEDDELGWVLAGWRLVRYDGDPGTYNNSFSEAAVNVPVDAGVFQALAQDFPDDTVLVARASGGTPTTSSPCGPREGEATAQAERSGTS